MLVAGWRLPHRAESAFLMIPERVSYSCWLAATMKKRLLGNEIAYAVFGVHEPDQLLDTAANLIRE